MPRAFHHLLLVEWILHTDPKTTVQPGLLIIICGCPTRAPWRARGRRGQAARRRAAAGGGRTLGPRRAQIVRELMVGRLWEGGLGWRGRGSLGLVEERENPFLAGGGTW